MGYGANCQPMTGAACYGSVHSGNIGPNGGLTCCCSAGGGGLGTSSMGGSGGMFDMFGSGNSDPFSGGGKGKGPKPGKTEESCAQYGANCQPMTGAACYGSVHSGNIGPNGGLTCCCSAGGGGLGTSSMGGSGGMFDMFGSGNSDPFSGNSGLSVIPEG